MLTIRKFFKILRKTFSGSPSKYLKKHFLERIKLSYKLAMVTIQLFTTGNSVNSYLTTTVDKTHDEPVIASFSVQMSSAVFLATPEVS